MNQLIPFKKDIVFKTKISDITSISLEHKIEIKNKSIFLEFIIGGDYKMTETSINKEKFEYNLPFEVDIDDKYDITDINVDIDDFYYEIINNEILRINITISIDNLIIIKDEKVKLEEFESNTGKTILDIDILDDNFDDVRNFENENLDDDKTFKKDNLVDENCEREIIMEYEDTEKNENEFDDIINNNNIYNEEKIINSIFSNISDEETYKTYHVYIMREEDTLEKILVKYNITKEILNEYNSLDNLKIGDKIIIPNIN